MDKKLQVFVSSTYKDLLKERQAAVEAILASGHIPAGMELFSAGDESQLGVIKRWINESDVFLLILGGRYGSIEPKSGKSYIQLEYEYAIENNKPFFAVVIKENALNNKVSHEGKEVLELENPKKYKEFKNKVLDKMCDFFEDEKDIKLSIHTALSDFNSRKELTGWVSGSETKKIDGLLKQNTKLLEEKEILKEEIEQLKKNQLSTRKVINGYPYDKILKALQKEKIVINIETNEEKFDEEINLIKGLLTFANLLAIGVSNKYGANEIERFLYFHLVPKLMTYGLVELTEVSGVQWQRGKITKEGFDFLTWIKTKSIK